jgi:PilZ domain
METKPPSSERRSPRRRVLMAGMVCFNGRHSTLPCAVRDFGEHGAILKMSGSIQAPDTFELHVELSGTWVDCEVAWRRGEELGVRFTSAIVISQPKRRQVVNDVGELTKPSLRRVRPATT